MIKLKDAVDDSVMWVKEESITAILKNPHYNNLGRWTIYGSGWKMLVADLPSKLKWMVQL